MYSNEKKIMRLTINAAVCLGLFSAPLSADEFGLGSGVGGNGFGITLGDSGNYDSFPHSSYYNSYPAYDACYNSGFYSQPYYNCYPNVEFNAGHSGDCRSNWERHHGR